jgi:hypothetical protein
MHSAVHGVKNLPARCAHLLLHPKSERAAAFLESRHVRASAFPRVVPLLEVIQERSGQKITPGAGSRDRTRWRVA